VTVYGQLDLDISVSSAVVNNEGKRVRLLGRHVNLNVFQNTLDHHSTLQI
jgi:hypothetical protein